MTPSGTDDRDDARRDEGAERRQYHHDPAHGETRYPPEGGESDPHSALNTPVSEIEARADEVRVGHRDSTADVTGMGRPESSDTRGSDGDPVERGGAEDREVRNAAQSTPRGVLDAEAEAMRRAEERTGVPLTDDAE